MPQASEELRAKMNEYFGDPVNDAGPHQFLLDSRHWLINEKWEFITDKYSAVTDIPQKEWDCIVFLVHEWDYSPEIKLVQ